jgi:2OG-Fe(II) oxygenase superfamily
MLQHIFTNFSDTDKLNDQFLLSVPDPMIVLDNFIPSNSAGNLFDESENIPDDQWTHFTRRGSFMKECTKLHVMPVAFELVSALHSPMFLNWLEKITGLEGLIPDPHLIGAGYSKSYTGDSLKIHTDFNWNDRLRLHRAVSIILYLTPHWEPEWNGSLEFYDHNRKNMVKSIDCLYNRCVIWKYHKRGFHGYPTPLACPDTTSRTTFRLFYYVSKSEYDLLDRPHRSLYWYDEEMNEPYDIPTKR